MGDKRLNGKSLFGWTSREERKERRSEHPSHTCISFTRAQTPLALLGSVLGALETAGAVQELVFRGILQSLTGPLCIGTVGGVFVLATCIALRLRSAPIDILILATAWLSVPTFIISGVIYHYAGWPITAAGIAFPLVLVALHRKPTRAASQPS